MRLSALLLAARGLARGALSLGDVVAVNALLLQLGRTAAATRTPLVPPALD